MARVHYPGLESHPEHQIAKRQMSGFGGVISFEVLSLFFMFFASTILVLATSLSMSCYSTRPFIYELTPVLSQSQINGDLETTSNFIDGLRIPYIAPSLGGVESLVEQPTIISYWYVFFSPPILSAR